MPNNPNFATGIVTSSLKNLNETHRNVLSHIRQSGLVSRTQLANYCGISAPAITKVAKELLGRGLIKEAGRGSNTRGQPATQLSIDPLGAFSIGLHIEQDICSLTLLDFSGKSVVDVRYSGIFTSPTVALQMIFYYLNALLQSNPEATKKLVGIGVAIGGNFIVNHHKIIPRREMKEWQNIDLHDVFFQQYQLPIYIENDASAAAIGENISGQGYFYKDFFYIYMGFGLGGAFLHNGRLIRGVNGNAGELGRLCPTTHPRPTLNSMAEILNYSVKELTNNKIEELFNNKNKAFFLWLDEAIGQINLPINAVRHLIDPEAIIISSFFPNNVTNYIIDNIKLYPLGEYYDSIAKPKLLLAKIPGREAICYGAATLPFYEYL
jgi:predicted NBD/HSP70 family sugar kinase